MDTKLTLKLDKSVIEKAKQYASEKNRSLSAIIESYLKSLTSETESKDFEEIKITPFVKSLSFNSGVAADLDYKKELGDYYTEKYE